VAVVGCGALGSQLAETMVRAGVSFVRIIDRDVVEESNLQRQSLYVEDDARSLRPKAIAAGARLRAINGDVTVEAHVADLSLESLDALLGSVDLVLDGTDNFETRYLVNDWTGRAGASWVYGACVGSYGLTLPVLRGGGRRTPCLRCVLGDAPPAGSSPTCDTAGVIAPIVQAVAALQAADALKILSGNADAVRPALTSLDVWEGRFDRIDLAGVEPSCDACVRGVYPALDPSGATSSSGSAYLCGRDAVQIRPPQRLSLDFAELERAWSSFGAVTRAEHILRLVEPNAEVLLFSDGRALIKGTSDLGRARAIYARLVGV
jgi:adenylyltransferase/sulfurtransferase